ncbi:hypothetical protein [Streptomyces sp. NPDC090080]|uniref:hypothetical protein n=1 Tax=Streptomyces sp. NPDC090080 TaxID=3365939 RepID=UPI0038086808
MQHKEADALWVRVREASWLPNAGEPPADFAREEPPSDDRPAVREPRSALDEKQPQKADEAGSVPREPNERKARPAVRRDAEAEVESVVHSVLHRKIPVQPAPPRQRTRRRDGPSREKSAQPQGGAVGGAAIVLCALIAAAAFILLSHGIHISLFSSTSVSRPSIESH